MYFLVYQLALENLSFFKLYLWYLTASLASLATLWLVFLPLLSLIKDQTVRLRQVGISCVSLSDPSTQGEIDLVEGGFYSVVYATPD